MGFISKKATFKCGSINKASLSNSIAGLVSFCSNAINCGPICSGLFFGTSINNNLVGSGSFSGSAVNSGSLTTGVFAATSLNFGCACVATFTGSSINRGSVTGATFAASSANSGFLITGTFSETSLNLGSVCSAIFTGSSINRGTVTGATFGESSVNSGYLNTGTFVGTSLNFGSVCSGAFTGSSVNRGTVNEAVFAGNTVNGGIVANATFSDAAQNTGSITGFVTFLGSAINSGSVQNAVFSGSTCNLGTIVSSGSFFGSSSNSGVVSGNVIFSGNSVNVGTVCGDAIFAENSYNDGGIVCGSATTESGDPYFFRNVMLLNGDGSNCQTNATFLDSSTGNYLITNCGVTQGSFSPFSPNGWSAYFNGNSFFFISTGLNGACEGITGIGIGKTTFEAWICPTCFLTCRQSLFGTATSNATNGRYHATLVSSPSCTGAKLQFSYTTSTSAEQVICTSDNSICLNSWQHIAISIDATTPSSSEINLYVNGNKCCFTGQNLSSQTFSDCFMRIAGTTAYTIPYWGYMSNLRIVKGQDVYTDNFTPTTQRLTPTSQGVTGCNTKLLLFNENRFVDKSCQPKSLTINCLPSIQPLSPFNPTELYNPYKHGGSAYMSNGTRLTAPKSAFNLGSGSFTIEFWVYPTLLASSTGADGTNTFRIIGSEGEASIPGYGWFIGVDKNTSFPMNYNGLNFRYGNYGVGVVGKNTGNFLNYQQWHHIVVQRNVSTLSIYVNGISQNLTTFASGGSSIAWSDTFNFNNTTATFDKIGDAVAQNQPFYLSNVRIIRGVALYSGSTITVPTQSFAATTSTSLLLKFANGKISDKSATTILQSVGDVRVSTTQIKYGSGSLFFDGVGDYLSIPNNNVFNFGAGDFTVEFWIYPLAYGGTTAGAQIFGTVNGSQAGYSINLGQDINSFRVISNASGTWTSDATVSAGNGPALNTWTHIAVVRQGASLRIYKNGISVASSSAMLNKNYSGTTAIIGRYSDGATTRDFNGYIDDLRISKGIARYTSNFTPPDAGLLPINIL